MEQETKNCQNCKKDFVIESEDFNFYEKMKVSAPTWCPECRFQRRLCFMNERVLYKRNCDLCGKSIVCTYAVDSLVHVYCNECWWSDKWDGTQYGQDYNPATPFFVQFQKLNLRAPKVALEVNYPTLINSEYINHAATSKNCYLIYTADYCENVLYSQILAHIKDSMDITRSQNLELCYDVLNGARSNRLFFSEGCVDCSDVYFSKNCRGCQNCFGCINLRRKNYYIFNQSYTKEEYEKKLNSFNLSSYKAFKNIKSEVSSFWLRYPYKFMEKGSKSTNVSGEIVIWSKNAKHCWNAVGLEDSKFCQLITMPSTKDAYDYTIWGNGAEKIYECMIVGEGAEDVKFCYQVWPNVREIEYSQAVLNSSNIFGCSNIRNKQYCILNKQYSKEEFEKLREQIIRDMNEKPFVDSLGRTYKYGEFFPPELSIYGYNESYADDFFTLTENEAKAKGFNWSPEKNIQHKPTVVAVNLPDNINDVEDNILKEIIECDNCKKPFKIIATELNLLRRFKFPLPRNCPVCRYKERLSHLNLRKLWHRKCMNPGCLNEFETSYAPDRPEIIYCESCYNKEVV